jgi:hypothetical protein
MWKSQVETVVDLKDGVIPLADIQNPMEAVDVVGLQIFLEPGSWRIRCRCEGEEKGTSVQVTVDYDVLPKTEPPDLLATAGIVLLQLCNVLWGTFCSFCA